MGMLNRICSQRMIFLSVDAFMRYLFALVQSYQPEVTIPGKVDLSGKCVDKAGPAPP